LSHLFYFNSSGNLESSTDITADIPGYHFLNFSISATNDGGVIISELYGSRVWVYHSPPVELDLSGAGVTSIGGVGGSYFQSEYDFDGIPNGEDNCPTTFNPEQEDKYPPASNNCGDACECEGNFNPDEDVNVDGSDLALFKADFGRNTYNEPCHAGDRCNGNFDCDEDLDGSDAFIFKVDFGRSPFLNPCIP